MNKDSESVPSMAAADTESAVSDSLQLAYVISHDLRARTRAIQVHARLMSAGGTDALDEGQRQRLTQIETAAIEADALLVDLVDWLRVDGSALKITPVDLAFLADWAAADLQGQKSDTTITLQIQGEMTVEGDERMLQLMMRQLLRHACAGVAAGTAIDVSIDAEPVAADRLRIRLHDNGAPCSAAAFDASAHFVASGDSTRTQASGISLSIARRVAQRHGGSLGLCNAADGAGCVVLIELPRHASRKREA